MDFRSFGLGLSAVSMGSAAAAPTPAPFILGAPTPLQQAALAEANGNTTGSFVYYTPKLLAAGVIPPHIRYELEKDAFYRLSEEARQSGDKAAFLNKCNDELRTKSDANYRAKDGDAVITQPVPLLQNFSVKYANAMFIGLNLMPVMPSEQEAGEYTVYRRYGEFDVTRSGQARGTRVQGIEATGPNYTKAPFLCKSDSTLGYMGKDVVLATNTPVNGMFDLRERVDMNMAFKRELRIRDALTNASNYGSNNKRTLTAGTRWDDPSGDPGADILDARAKLWGGTGSNMTVAWCSIDVWNVIRQSPNMLKLLPLSHQGYVTPQQFCEIFSLDGLMVSESWIASQNIAKQIASPSFTRVWGKFFGLCKVSRIPQQRNAAFGYTYRWMPSTLPSGMENNLWFDPKEGDFGSFGYKSALKETHVVSAPDAGFLFSTVIS